MKVTRNFSIFLTQPIGHWHGQKNYSTNTTSQPNFFFNIQKIFKLYFKNSTTFKYFKIFFKNISKYTLKTLL